MGRSPPASEAGASTALRHARAPRRHRLESSATARSYHQPTANWAAVNELVGHALCEDSAAFESFRSFARITEPPASKAHVESAGLNAEVEGDLSDRLLRKPAVELVPARPAKLQAFRVTGM
jgi:hypothetical protein